ncbi:hypothetical protein RCH12_003505 [Cryobacterium sp. MP_3.1]|nr:hypothetical protein [Cryobacterium sp. MP_3.1]
MFEDFTSNGINGFRRATLKRISESVQLDYRADVNKVVWHFDVLNLSLNGESKFSTAKIALGIPVGAAYRNSVERL